MITTIMALVLSALIVTILGPFIIPMLRKLKFGQTIREDGPQTHLSKNGTPTMGGIMMVLAIIITTLFLGNFSLYTLIALVSMFGFGLVGFLDDYIKVVKKRSLGLKAWEKIVLQVFFATLIPVAQYFFIPETTKFLIPFTSLYIDFGLLYVPFMIFVIIGTVNAVNLTDGLDGLSSSVTTIVSLFFIIVCFLLKLNDLSVFSASVMGACLGFLVYNRYPAKVFMGDTGSMALGGAVIGMASLTNLTLLIPIIGGIYFAEALSVIIQVTSFRFRKKRVFKMAPIHHHFEQCGWKETKVVKYFCLISFILFIISIISVL